MRIILLFFVISTLSIHVFGQDKEIILQHFVKKDTVQLRWAPTSPDLFIEGLKKGYEIKKTRISDGEETVFKIEPFKSRKASLFQSKDSTVLFITSFIAEFESKSFSNPAEKQMPYFMMNLSSSTDRRIASVCGLYFEDTAINKTSYQYEIRFIGDSKFADKIEVDAEILSVNPKCSELNGSSRIDLKEVYLAWEGKSMNAFYGGYWIMKSENGSDFYRLNSTPVFFLTSQYEPNKIIVDFVDTAVTEGMTYYYQITPINHFAELGPSSNKVEVYIQKRLNGICNIDTVKSEKYTRLIEGSYRSTIDADEVKEFVLYRSLKVDSGFQEINRIAASGNQFEFKYEANLLSGDRQYFKVAAISIDRDTVFSFPYYHFSLDQEPPGIPSNFTGIISDSGLVYLKWTAPNDNDIQGYRIMRANSLNEEFIEVTKKLSAADKYVDTLALNNLTSEVYYRIRTVDFNYNNSPLSPPILILKPDTIPPVASVIKDYLIDEKGIHLSWYNSRSEDLSNQYLLREGLGKIDTILKFRDEYNDYIDSTCNPAVHYKYWILTLDKNDNRSESESLDAVFEKGYRDAPAKFTALGDRINRKIIITWEIPVDSEIYSIQIYRSKNQGKFQLHKTIREEVLIFEDYEISQNNTYSYKIKITYKSGHSGKVSEAIQVIY